MQKGEISRLRADAAARSSRAPAILPWSMIRRSGFHDDVDRGGLRAQIAAGGFLLNNELTDFSFEPVIDGKPVANASAPGKRPLSAMSPVIVFGPDGKFFAALGRRAAARSSPMSRRES